MKLSEYLNGYATKRLTAVDIPGKGSNQREINGVSSLRSMLGSTKITGTIQWNYMLDDREDSLTEAGEFTFYDARENHETRTEWRLYYSPNAVMAAAEPDDLLVVLRVKGRPETELYGFVFPFGSSWNDKAIHLFGSFEFTVGVQNEADLSRVDVELANATLLDMLGLGMQPTESSITARANARFPEGTFPKTRALADFARESFGDVSHLDPDAKLEAWLKQEAQLFYAIEQRIVGARIMRPNAFPSVEEFLRYSLGVQNRRKSRMGWSLELHLEEIFRQAGVHFDHPGVTEGKSRPDFLFPGNAAYGNSATNASMVRMLAAKATCKDRWRQILAEADRIKSKHLCTLEPAISESQILEMHRHSVTLVAPARIHDTYPSSLRNTIRSLSEFVREVKSIQ